MALIEADACLDQLRQYLELAWRWQWVSASQLEHALKLTERIGRLLGGWGKRADTAAAAHEK